MFTSTQIIESRELQLRDHIGSGAYGKVWLAEWLNTQVAVKELINLSDKFKVRRAFFCVRVLWGGVSLNRAGVGCARAL